MSSARPRGEAPPDLRAEEIEGALLDLIAREFLDGDAEGLTATTPLLEYGILTSQSLLTAVVFVEERYGVAVPSERLTPENLRDVASLAALVLRLRGTAAGP